MNRHFSQGRHDQRFGIEDRYAKDDPGFAEYLRGRELEMVEGPRIEAEAIARKEAWHAAEKAIQCDAVRYRRLRAAMMAEPPVEDEVQEWEYALAVAFTTEEFDGVVDALDHASGEREHG